MRYFFSFYNKNICCRASTFPQELAFFFLATCCCIFRVVILGTDMARPRIMASPTMSKIKNPPVLVFLRQLFHMSITRAALALVIVCTLGAGDAAQPPASWCPGGYAARPLSLLVSIFPGEQHQQENYFFLHFSLTHPNLPSHPH